MSVLDAIREKRLNAAKASVRYQEATTERTRDLAADVKHMLKGETGVAQAAEESNLRTMYSRMVDDYYGGTQFQAYAVMNNRSKALWKRVKNRCVESCVDPESFLKAQFVWFDKNFGKPPTVIQLTTEAAVDRAKEFGGTVASRVVANTVPAKLDFASIMRRSEQQLQEMMRAHDMTREEVYKNFVITGLFSFPPEFLKADPAYKRAMNE